MRVACLSDLHLGFRAFPAVDGGRNVREVDVEKAWGHAVREIVAGGCDLVIISGDIYHHPRISDHARLAFLVGLKELVGNDIPVVILQGNHDAAKTADVLTPLELSRVMSRKVHLVTEPKRLLLTVCGGVRTSIACFPFTTGADPSAYRLAPDADVDVNILAMHAAVKGMAEGEHMLPRFYGGDVALDVGRVAAEWDIVACGDYHEFTMLSEEGLAFYSGSLERTSSNIWQEDAAKGFVIVDVEDGHAGLTFCEIPTRRMHDFDLGDFDMPPGTGARELRDVLADLLTRIEEGAIVRLKVDAFPRDERDHLPWEAINAVKAKALHFQLDIRCADAPDAIDLGDHRDGGTSLRNMADGFFDDEIKDLAFTYLFGGDA